MTRKEYYESQGFSGSEISNPNDEVDDLFIEHVQKLKNAMEAFIQRNKDMDKLGQQGFTLVDSSLSSRR